MNQYIHSYTKITVCIQHAVAAPTIPNESRDNYWFCLSLPNLGILICPITQLILLVHTILFPK